MPLTVVIGRVTGDFDLFINIIGLFRVAVACFMAAHGRLTVGDRPFAGSIERIFSVIGPATSGIGHLMAAIGAFMGFIGRFTGAIACFMAGIVPFVGGTGCFVAGNGCFTVGIAANKSPSSP